MHPVAAWLVGATYITYKYGYKCKMLPLPKRYIALTGFVSLAALIGMANSTVGALIGYGSLLGVYLHDTVGASAKTPCDKPPCDKQQSSSGTPNASPAPGPSQPNPPGMPQPRPGPL